MLTNSKHRILQGVINNLLSKISGYPTVTLITEFTFNTTYTIDLKNKILLPNITLSATKEDLLIKLFAWFDKELDNKKVELSDIEQCVARITILQAKFLFIHYNKYKFEVLGKTSAGEFAKLREVKGWL